MKLGLLVLAVVVAVVLVPSLSEGRIVSKCELKDKLWKHIVVPKWFSKTDKEHLLAVVICELNRTSLLNTSMLNVMGDRGLTATTTVPKEVTPWADEKEEEEAAYAEEMPTEETPAEEQLGEDMTEGETTEATPTEARTSKTTTKTTTTEPTKPKLQAGKKRPKRMVEIFDEENIWTAYEMKMEERVNLIKSNCDEEEVAKAEDKIDIEDSDSNTEGDEENQQPWSLGRYGIFQLSDGYYCNSGHRWSKNKCKKSCSAFTDDDITDDFECFVKIGCWKKIFQESTLRCSRIKNYFDECKTAKHS